MALHLEIDALDQLRLEDERAAGYERNRSGGFGRRGSTRKADVRQGFASRKG